MVMPATLLPLHYSAMLCLAAQLQGNASHTTATALVHGNSSHAAAITTLFQHNNSHPGQLGAQLHGNLSHVAATSPTTLLHGNARHAATALL